MDEKRPIDDFRVDNNIARTADNTLEVKQIADKTLAETGGIKEAIIANGGNGSLKGIENAIKELKSGGSSDSVLRAIKPELKEKSILISGTIQYEIPLYVNNDVYAIFDLRNNFPSSPVILKIEGQSIPLVRLGTTKYREFIPALYQDLYENAGFNVLFSKDIDGKILAYFLGSALPPAFSPIGKFDLKQIDLSIGIRFDTRYHHIDYTKIFFINNPQHLTGLNRDFTIDLRTVIRLVPCYDWTKRSSDGSTFLNVSFPDYTKKYKLIRVDLVSDSEAFITPLSEN